MLSGRAEQLCRELLPNGRREGAEWRVGSVAGESGKSLGVHLFGSKAGVWSDFATGQGGDLLDLVAVVLDVSIGEAIGWARNWLGLGATVDPSQSPNSKPRPAKADQATLTADERRRTQLARELWQRALPADDTPAEIYLRLRGVTIKIPPTIRYLPDAKHGRSGLFLPAFNRRRHCE